jgi:hypothetical protein
MKKVIIFFLLLLQSVILPQNNFIQQITNGDFDARNPFIYKDEYGYSPNLFFELHKDGYSNIYSISYNSSSSIFGDTVALTSGNYFNHNPSFEANSGLLYQTNINGNWDIVLIPDSNGIFLLPVYLTSSSNDEYNPEYFESTKSFRDSTNIIFKRANQVVSLTYKQNQIEEYVLFEDNLDIHYSNFIGLEEDNWGIYSGFYVFAIEESNLNEKRIVKRFKPFNGNWEQISVVKNNCDCSDLSLNITEYVGWTLFYQDTLENEKRIFMIESPFSSIPPDLLEIPNSGNVSSFDMYSLLIVGKELEKNSIDPLFYWPYTFRVQDSSGSYVRINKNDLGYWSEDSLVAVQVSNANLAVGSVGEDYQGMVVYTVWEDSIGGHIQLFGTPTHLAYGSVDDESVASDFVLYQNYPNPFNPATTIEYKLLQASDVKFNVFNILGEKVFEQNFGYQTAGRYKLNFNGANLPSGVYVYSIYTNENRLSRKMMLMK